MMQRLSAKLHRAWSRRSRIRAWTLYTAIGYESLTVTVVGLTLEFLAKRTGTPNPVDLRGVFVCRGAGAVVGSVLGGLLADALPIRLVVSAMVLVSAGSILAVPLCSSLGLLAAAFAVVGASGGALVVVSLTAANWAFADEVGPVIAGCTASFSIASALLPLLLFPVWRNGGAEYLVVAVCALPALALVAAFEPPHREVHGEEENVPRRVAPALAAGFLVNFCLVGASSSLLVWSVPFAHLENLDCPFLPLLVTMLSGAGTAGSLASMHYQQSFDAWYLAKAQLALGLVGTGCWLLSAKDVAASFAGLAWHGFVAMPVVAYITPLYNSYARTQRPTGLEVAVLSLGNNCGANLGPYLSGALMQACGPRALLGAVFVANALALALIAAASSLRVAVNAEPLLGEPQ